MSQSQKEEMQELCRLCAQKITCGFDVFVESEERASLDILINKYLPIKVVEDDTLPKKICEPCHMGMAATVDFIDRLVDGQQTLFRKTSPMIIEKIRELKRELPSIQIQTQAISIPQGNEQNPSNLKSDGTNLLDDFSISMASSQSQFEDSIVFESLQDDTPNVLVNIQGHTPDVEMDDLAQGTDITKVYENHPLMTTVDNIYKKNIQSKPSTNQQISSRNSHTSERPKRKTSRPNRYSDSLSGGDLEHLVKRRSRCVGDEADIDLIHLEQPQSSLNTMSCGTTVIITPNHNEDQLKMPAAANIELNIAQGEGDDPDKAFSSSVEFVMQSKEELVVEDTKPPKCSLDKRKLKKKKWFCELCKKEFSYKGRFLLHQQAHSKYTFQCNVCKEEFAIGPALTQHQEQSGHTGVGILKETKPTTCPLCPDKSFSSEDSLASHNAIHHKKEIAKPHSCTYCNKGFARIHSLKSHTKYCTALPGGRKEPKFSCDECGKLFRRQCALGYHRETKHSAGSAQYVCTICGKSFKHKQVLQRHYASVHTDERPFPCGLCNVKFKTKSNLYNHQVTHLDYKKYTCEICSKQFNHLTSLTFHIKSHTGDKPHECPWCQKRFVQKGNLVEHMRVHTGEKPFACEICKRSFTTSSQAKTHQQIHIASRFRCTVCRKGFAEKQLLLDHVQLLHSEHSYVCYQCNQKFSDKRYLTKHLKTHLNKQPALPTIDLGTSINVETKGKEWSVPTEGTNEAMSPNVIYIISKKDESTFSFNTFADEMFVPEQDPDNELVSIDPATLTQYDTRISKSSNSPPKDVRLTAFNDENINTTFQFVTDEQANNIFLSK